MQSICVFSENGTLDNIINGQTLMTLQPLATIQIFDRNNKHECLKFKKN